MEVDRILGRVGEHFGDLLEDDANPLEAALSLMDESSIGKARYASEFAKLQIDVKAGMRRQVDHNYQGFNSSVGVYRTFVNGIHQNHKGVQDVGKQLNEVRRTLAKRRPMLLDLQQNSLKYEQMLKLLDVVESLKQVPDKYEAQVSQKKFQDAHDTLNHALETINSYDLLKVPAIQPLHSYIVAQQMSLIPTLIEELTSHVYLRSPYTTGRFTEFNANDLATMPEDALAERLHMDATGRQVSEGLTDLIYNLKEPLKLDASTPAEQNSFVYIRAVLETLAKLDGLQQALSTLQSKLKDDIHRLVEKTVADVIRAARITPESIRVPPGTLFEQFSNPAQSQQLATLQSLARTVFSKFLAVLEGHRAIYEVVTVHKIGAYDLKAVWDAVEKELRQFFLTYVDDGPSVRPRSRSWSSVSKSLAHSEFMGPVYSFASTDPSDADLREQMEALQRAMKKSVPGLVVLADDDFGDLSMFADGPKDNKLTVVASVNVLNIRALLEPTAAFLQRARSVLVPVEAAETAVARVDMFLDNFLETTFMPRLETALQRSFEEVADDDGATEVAKHYNAKSQLPVMQAAVSFVEMLQLLTRLLNTGHQFRESYAKMLVWLMDIVQDFFDAKFNDYVASSTKAGKLVYTLATGDVLSRQQKNLREALAASTSSENQGAVTSAVAKELQVYIGKRHTSQSNKDVTLADLLDVESFRALALLATSLEWTCARLRELRRTQPGNKKASDNLALKQRLRKRWSLLDANIMSDASAQPGAVVGGIEDGEMGIMLAGNTLSGFDKTLTTMSNLSETALNILRCDIMCRVVYYFDRTSLEGKYNLQADTEELDSYIDILQRNISTCSNVICETLTEEDGRFVFIGIARLINELFILESENISGLNERGMRKMFSNILSLQQMLKSIVSDPKDVDFSRAIEFYEAVRSNPTRVLEQARAKKSQLTEDDLRLLLSNKHRQDLARRGENRDSGILHQQFSDQLSTLQAIFSSNT